MGLDLLLLVSSAGYPVTGRYSVLLPDSKNHGQKEARWQLLPCSAGFGCDRNSVNAVTDANAALIPRGRGECKGVTRLFYTVRLFSAQVQPRKTPVSVMGRTSRVMFANRSGRFRKPVLYPTELRRLIPRKLTFGRKSLPILHGRLHGPAHVPTQNCEKLGKDPHSRAVPA